MMSTSGIMTRSKTAKLRATSTKRSPSPAKKPQSPASTIRSPSPAATKKPQSPASTIRSPSAVKRPQSPVASTKRITRSQTEKLKTKVPKRSQSPIAISKRSIISPLPVPVPVQSPVQSKAQSYVRVPPPAPLSVQVPVPAPQAQAPTQSKVPTPTPAKVQAKVKAQSPSYTENFLENRGIYNNEIIELLKNVNEETCLKDIAGKKGMHISEKILIDELIGSGGFGKINLTIGDDKLEFATKFFEINAFNTKEIEISKFLSNIALKNKNPHFLIVYKSLTCHLPIDGYLYPYFFNYYMMLIELVDGSIDKIIYNNLDITNNILYQTLLIILSFHTTLYNNKKMFHNDTYTRNFLYKKIKPGGYFKYIINGKDYYIENMGYLVILWDYAGVVTDINIYDNYSTVPHTGEKIYYIKDYLLLLKDLKKLVQKPEFKPKIKKYINLFESYKYKSEYNLWISNILNEFTDTVNPSDTIITEIIINIPDEIKTFSELKNPNMNLSKIIEDKIIKPKLLNMLRESRAIIEERKDLFLDKEHKHMCEKVSRIYDEKIDKSKYTPDTKQQLEKYLEIEKDIMKELNIEQKDLKITYGYYKFSIDKLGYIIKKYFFKLNYNKYNKKFFNNLNHNFNSNVITNFIQIQNKFLTELDLREKLVLRDYVYGYTFFDVISKYEIGNFTYKDMITKFDIRRNEQNIFPFIYQLQQVLIEDHLLNIFNKEIVITDESVLDPKLIEILMDIKELKKINYNIWIKVLKLYMKDLSNIFDKAPKTTDEIVLYRGSGTDYIGPSSKKGYYSLNRFTSASLDSNIALNYADKYDRKKALIYRITISKGIPLIFVEPFNENLKNLVEVLIPKNCIFYIERGIKLINTFDKNNNICPYNKRTIKVLDIKLISYEKPKV